MMVLIVGLILFLGLHLLPTSPELRDGLKERVGETPYQDYLLAAVDCRAWSSSCSGFTSCSFIRARTRSYGTRRSGRGISQWD